MKKTTLIFFFFVLPVHAVPTGKITSIKGEVKYAKRALVKGDTLVEDGILSIGKDSFVNIRVDFWKGSFTLNENTALEIKFWNKGEKREYNLINGRCRWTDELREKIKKMKGRHIHTSNSIVKILKGDVVVDYDGILKETQLLVLSGQVVFQSRSDPNDRIILNKGLWGGIGGRFGDTVGEIVPFSLSAQKHFTDNKK